MAWMTAALRILRSIPGARSIAGTHREGLMWYGDVLCAPGVRVAAGCSQGPAGLGAVCWPAEGAGPYPSGRYVELPRAEWTEGLPPESGIR